VICSALLSNVCLSYRSRVLEFARSNQIKSFIVKTIKLTPMALNGATLQQQLAVHNTGAEPKND